MLTRFKLDVLVEERRTVRSKRNKRDKKSRKRNKSRSHRATPRRARVEMRNQRRDVIGTEDPRIPKGPPKVKSSNLVLRRLKVAKSRFGPRDRPGTRGNLRPNRRNTPRMAKKSSSAGHTGRGARALASVVAIVATVSAEPTAVTVNAEATAATVSAEATVVTVNAEATVATVSVVATVVTVSAVATAGEAVVVKTVATEAVRGAVKKALQMPTRPSRLRRRSTEQDKQSGI